MRNVKNANGLAIGKKVKDFSGTDQNGNKIQLSQLLKKGKVAVIFYRGQWCHHLYATCEEITKRTQQDQRKKMQVLF